MPAPRCPDAEFVRLFEIHGATATAQRLKISVRHVFARRRSIEMRIGRELSGPDHLLATRRGIAHPHRIEIAVPDGVVLVGSDGHYWPGPAPTAHRAFVRFCGELKPALVVMNGDVIDGARLSPRPPIGWERGPSLVEEVEAASQRLREVRLACPRQSRTIWILGNHDARFETGLAVAAPSYAKVRGFHLKDHFGEEWEPARSARINGSVVIMHRFRNGLHAAHTNVRLAGKTIVTGHTHALKVEPMTDYAGTRFGIDCGMLADPGGPQFRYLQGAPVDWRSGFIMLTFRAGRLLWPEIVHVVDAGHVDFRGEVIAV